MTLTFGYYIFFRLSDFLDSIFTFSNSVNYILYTYLICGGSFMAISISFGVDAMKFVGVTSTVVFQCYFVSLIGDHLVKTV